MILVLAAILPILAILLLGKSIGSTRLLSDEGWLGLESITYYVLFPALIVSNIVEADFSGIDWRMPVTLIAAQVILAALSVGIGKIFRQPGSRLGVFVQSAVRWNTFIALALAQNMIGPAGIVIVAAAAAAMIPTANLLSILALIKFSDGAMSLTTLAARIVGNPLILSFVVGLTINQLGIGLAPGMLQVLDILAKAAVGVGLLTSGAQIQFRQGGASISLVFGWSFLRLLGLPLIAGALAHALRVSPEVFLVILIATAVPTASNGAILARQLGGDAKLAANLIALQTLLALISVTGVLWAAQMLKLTHFSP
jgi:predicted permease